MKLGIIVDPNERSLKKAAEKKLDFVELCLNQEFDLEKLNTIIPLIKRWLKRYGLILGSVGRWKTERIDMEGRVIVSELNSCKRLIDMASDLYCDNFICGCNYIKRFSYEQNCEIAMDFLDKIVTYAGHRGVKVSTYNCRKVNFIYDPKAWAMIHGHMKELGIKFDPANSFYDGGDYLKEAADWGDRFYHVHLKGALLVNHQRFDDPPAGLDQIDWESLLAILYAKDYDRGLSIEPHSPTWTDDLGEWGVDYTIKYFKSKIYPA